MECRRQEQAAIARRLQEAGMCHTDIWDVQYGKIRVKYEIRVKHVRMLEQFFGSANLTQNGPDLTPKSPKTFPILLRHIIFYNIYVKHWKLVERLFWGTEIA